MDNFNDKPSPIQMRELLKRTRGGYVHETFDKPKKDLNMRDLLKITRTLNENNSGLVNKATSTDFEYEKDIADGFFTDMGYRLKGENNKPYLIITDEYIKLGGVVNGVIRFKFIVKQDKSNSGVEFEYTEDFSPENPENEEILKKIESYYDNFYNRMIDKLNNE